MGDRPDCKNRKRLALIPLEKSGRFTWGDRPAIVGPHTGEVTLVAAQLIIGKIGIGQS